VIEELLQEEIYDEADRFEILAMARAKRAVRAWKRKVRIRRAEAGEDAGVFKSDRSSIIVNAGVAAEAILRARDGDLDKAEWGDVTDATPLLQ
jgi:hypothetical protein